MSGYATSSDCILVRKFQTTPTLSALLPDDGLDLRILLTIFPEAAGWLSSLTRPGFLLRCIMLGSPTLADLLLGVAVLRGGLVRGEGHLSLLEIRYNLSFLGWHWPDWACSPNDCVDRAARSMFKFTIFTATCTPYRQDCVAIGKRH